MKDKELKRKIIHIFFGLPIILFLFLDFKYMLLIGFIALLHNIFIAPLYMKKLFRGNKNFDIGIIAYPVGVLFSLIVFKNSPIFASLLWASLSFGDGSAALIGTVYGKNNLKFNNRKSIEGMIAFFSITFLSGIIIYFLLMGKFPVNLNFLNYIIMLFLFSLFLAIIEVLPFKLSDNIIIPITGYIFLLPFYIVSQQGIIKHNFIFSYEQIAGIAVTLILGITAFLAKWLDLKSSATAIIFGILIILFSGIKTIVLLITFFVLSIIATKFRFSHKLKNNIAESVTGTRSLTSVIPKGIVPLFSSFFVFISSKPDIFLFSYVTVVTTATFDTVSSEMGKAFSKGAFSLLKLKKVKSGERGGISFIGTLFGSLSSLLILYISNIFFNLPFKLLIFAFLISFLSNFVEPFFYKLFYPLSFSKPFTNFFLSLTAFVLSLLVYPYLT